MILQIKTRKGSEKDIRPGDLVSIENQIYLALNRVETGFLLKSFKDDTSFYLEKNQDIEIVNDINTITG